MSNGSLRHPPELRIFFATEMWERYGFYVIQTLLALYLAQHFKWKDHLVYSLVGSFTALTYISPIIGGWIADHILGQKRAILAGAIILCISYSMLAFINSDDNLLTALAAIAVGTGLLKPSISSLLGNQYPAGSVQRESGFTIFYMGITTGIVLGTTIPSYLNDYFGWPMAFMSAAAGLIIAIITFSFGIYRYKICDYHPFQYNLKKIIGTIAIIYSLWRASFYILKHPMLADSAFISVALLALAYMLYCVKSEESTQARQTLILTLLCIISVMFWAFYFQMFMSFTLLIARIVRLQLFNIQFTPPYYVSIQSMAMIAFGFMISRYKHHITRDLHGIYAGNKFIWAMICMSLAYISIALACNFSSGNTLLSPLYIIPAYIMIALAEFLLSPVGLSVIATLAETKKVSTMMGIFLVSLGIGAFLAGKLSTLTAINIQDLSIETLKAHYAASFKQLACILLIATLICMVINFIISRLSLKPKLL